MSKEAEGKAMGELKKLRMMSPMSAEATVVRNYIDTLLGLPWKKKSKINKDLGNAVKVLDADHYGLEKVKERIVEYLAVQQRVERLKAPILCLVGAPGVGKTSLGQSIARATNRKFVRMSLGGVRDEAEIRGHRRTYIGSMPGKILQNMTKVGVRNPLFLLDEVDKMGMDFRGDPSSALLEVLDPEQNNTFVMFCRILPGIEPMYVRRCPRISASSRTPPSDMRTNLRLVARAIDCPSEVLPTPGAPTRHRIGALRRSTRCCTARYSTMRSFTFSNP